MQVETLLERSAIFEDGLEGGVESVNELNGGCGGQLRPRGEVG